MTSSHLDPINAAVALAGVIFAPAVASVVGPYAIILLCSTTGASWSLGRRRGAGLFAAFAYFTRLNMTAALATVSISNIIAGLTGIDDINWILACVAMGIGAIGDDWPQVGGWIAGRVGRFIDVLIERRAGMDRGRGRDNDGDLE